MSSRDESLLLEALAQAKKGSPSPNPHVGALVTDVDGIVVGRGFHPRPGEDHAEVAALREAGPRAHGGTLYVTLEPCNHYGRTPPCTEAVLASGIVRVVMGAQDPNPNVPGRGADYLRAAGVHVDVVAALAAQCAELIAPFAKHVRTGLPWVRLKLAASLDGRIATARGVSKWITGPAARRVVHALRR